eukprot:6540208-Prymnesium_polylepis.2
MGARHLPYAQNPRRRRSMGHSPPQSDRLQPRLFPFRALRTPAHDIALGVVRAALLLLAELGVGRHAEHVAGELRVELRPRNGGALTPGRGGCGVGWA